MHVHAHDSIFIAVYKNEDRLEVLLDSIFASDITRYSYEVYIINNFATARLQTKYGKYYGRELFVMENSVRPDYSLGHLARDWNTGLIQGFRDLDNPISKIVALVQGDSQVAPDIGTKLYRLHMNESMEFVQDGVGDEFLSFRPRGVIRIGLFDERFSNVGFQEDDYFIRAVDEYLDDEMPLMTLNDHHHRRLFNPRNIQLLGKNRESGDNRRDPDHAKSRNHGHPFSEHMRNAKVGPAVLYFSCYKDKATWLEEMSCSSRIPRAQWPNHDAIWEGFNAKPRRHAPMPPFPSFMLYPYFERKVIHLGRKGWCVPAYY